MKPDEMLKAIMDHYHWDQVAVSKRYNVDQSQVSRWLSGQRCPNGMAMVAIYEDFKQIS